jgi:hypothetical protein
MSCPHCRTLSCYNCRQIIDGYGHFDQGASTVPSGSRKTGRHADEVRYFVSTISLRQLYNFPAQVKAAAEKALAEFRKNNPDANPSDIKLDIPKAPPGPGSIHYNAFNQNVNNNNQFNIAAMNANQARLQQMAQPQAAGVWGVGMHMPPAAVVPIAAQQPAADPVPAVPPPPVPGCRRVPGRGPALIAQARRAAGRRKGANLDGPRIAHHATNVRADPGSILHRQAPQMGLDIPPPLQPVVPPAPAQQNVLPQFHFGMVAPAGLGGGIVPQQPLYGASSNVDAAQRQRRVEAFDVNERVTEVDE